MYNEKWEREPPYHLPSLCGNWIWKKKILLTSRQSAPLPPSLRSLYRVCMCVCVCVCVCVWVRGEGVRPCTLGQIRKKAPFSGLVEGNKHFWGNILCDRILVVFQRRIRSPWPVDSLSVCLSVSRSLSLPLPLSLSLSVCLSVSLVYVCVRACVCAWVYLRVHVHT